MKYLMLIAFATFTANAFAQKTDQKEIKEVKLDLLRVPSSAVLGFAVTFDK